MRPIVCLLLVSLSMTSMARSGTIADIRIIQNGVVDLATEVFGPEDGPPLILAMGATASMVWWPDELCDSLADKGFRVVRYDSRDTGQSTLFPPGAPDYAAEDMMDDLLAVMDRHGFSSAHVAGMSLGGYVGQMAAIDHPDRIRSLTLIASEPIGGAEYPLPGIDERFLAHFDGFAKLDWSSRPDVTAFLLEIARLSAGGGRPFDAAAAKDRIDRELDHARDMRSAFNHGQVSTRRDWTGKVRQIDVPVLVIHGEDDPILPLANGEAIARLVPGARLLVLKGTGHELVRDDLGTISEAIAGFALCR